MKITFNNRAAVYVQVIQHFKEQIAARSLKPGQEISSRSELAKMLKTNQNTAQHPYKEMEEQGLIYTEGNLPSRITKDEQVLHAVKDELILQAVNSFITSIRSIHVPLDEAIEVIKKNYEKDDQEKGDSDD